MSEVVDIEEVESTENKKRKRGRAKGSGWLVRRGKFWCACWKHDGKLYKRTTGTDNKSKAWEKLEEFTRVYRLNDEKLSLAALAARVEETEERIKAEIAKKPALSLAEAWGIYQPILLRRVQPSTAKVDNCHFEIFCEWVAKNYPDATQTRDITRKMAREFYEHMSNKSTPRSAWRYVSTFSQCWAALIARDETAKEERGGKLIDDFKAARIASNPWSGLEKKKDRQKFSRRELTVDELNRVYNATAGEMRLLFAVGIYTGLRLGDCALLDWGKVDIVRGFISLSPHKTISSSGVSIREAIPDPLREMLSDIPEDKRVGYVLPEIAEQYKTSAANLCHNIQKIFHDCGIETTVEVLEGKRKRTLVGFHSLRHTYVSLVLNRGGSMSVVQKTVGHTSAVMTGHYLHLDETALKATAALLPDIRATAEKPSAAAVVDFAAVYKTIDGMDLTGLEQVRAYIEKRVSALKVL